jgi:hypothetical protein
MLKASPNPVPAGPGMGATTISWNTGTGLSGQVYVLPSGKPEKLFAQGRKGSKDATWIQAGRSYQFRFYEGTDRKKLLASVEVTRDAK